MDAPAFDTREARRYQTSKAAGTKDADVVPFSVSSIATEMRPRAPTRWLRYYSFMSNSPTKTVGRPSRQDLRLLAGHSRKQSHEMGRLIEVAQRKSSGARAARATRA